jgi:hypothetical protein
MGIPVRGDQRTIFVGIAKADGLEPPTLNEALESAALQAIEAKLIDSEKTAWFDIAFIEVELGNQHPRTFVVGVAPQGGGG